jgi:TRAP-type C4-dicarboxylate transport system substrate-binding protein
MKNVQRKNTGVLLVLALGLVLSSAQASHSQTIKLGALAPVGSPWHRGLEEIGSRWRGLSGGRLKLRIYPGGIAGSEEDIVRKMRIGQLQGAAISAFGLTAIHPDVGCLLLPFLIRDDRELAYVLEAMTPYFSRRFEDRGFALVTWIATGWFYFYSKEEVVHPDDLRRQKLWVRPSDANEIRAWQDAGFRVVPLAATNVLASLNSGMIEACAVSPLAAVSMQWFAMAPNMCDMRVSPMIGALVVSTRSMRRIPADLRPAVVESAADVTNRLAREVADLDARAVQVMLDHGLTINPVPDRAMQAWRDTMDEAFGNLAGASFSRESYDLLRSHIEKFRRRADFDR